MQLCFMLSLFIIGSLTASSNGSLCLSYEDFRNCSSSSTWAVNTPFLTVAHDFTPTLSPSFTVTYKLTAGNLITPICAISYYSSGSCRVTGTACVNCSNAYYSSTQTLLSEFTISPIDTAKDGSLLQYDISSAFLFNQTVAELLVSECPKTVGGLKVSTTSVSPCGFNCSSQFVCGDSTTVDPESHQCTAFAEWNPVVNDSVCSVSDTTTDNSIGMTMTFPSTERPQETTTENIISSTKTPATNETNSEKLDGCSKAAFTITIVGCILTVIFAITVACAMKKMWRFKKEPASKMFYLGFVAAAAVCVLAIGLLFGSAACVAATIIGAIGSCSMLLVTGLYAREAMTETKGIQGKKIEAAAEL